jgi:formylglycine-generating enzyme required for sulfatase activity
MKSIISVISFFLLFTNLYPQTAVPQNEPKGMKFVRAGSFRTTLRNVSQPREVLVTVDPFWMSNEISNSEFRQFVNWAKNNPEKGLFETEFSKETKTDPVSLITKDTIIVRSVAIPVSSFSGNVIDKSLMENEDPAYKNYFDDPAFDQYPVVGVSFKMAKYYCLWKTMLENDSLRKAGLPIVQAYRIPLENEWEYAAQKLKMGNSQALNRLHKVNEGLANDFGLSGMEDNASEWAISTPGQIPVIRGGSWQSGTGTAFRQEADINTRNAYTGFRIVRSFTSGFSGIGRIR